LNKTKNWPKQFWITQHIYFYCFVLFYFYRHILVKTVITELIIKFHMFCFKFEAKNCLHYVLAMIYVLSTVVSTIYMVSGTILPSSFNKPNTDEWRITFYTGDKMWSGTDSMVYIQVHGEIDSQIFQVNKFLFF